MTSQSHQFFDVCSPVDGMKTLQQKKQAQRSVGMLWVLTIDNPGRFVFVMFKCTY